MRKIPQDDESGDGVDVVVVPKIPWSSKSSLNPIKSTINQALNPKIINLNPKFSTETFHFSWKVEKVRNFGKNSEKPSHTYNFIFPSSPLYIQTNVHRHSHSSIKWRVPYLEPAPLRGKTNPKISSKLK